MYFVSKNTSNVKMGKFWVCYQVIGVENLFCKFLVNFGQKYVKFVIVYRNALYLNSITKIGLTRGLFFSWIKPK